MVKAKHPNNTKRLDRKKDNGASACFREYLPVPVACNHYLSKFLILEVTLKNKKGYLISFYRSSNQNLDKFKLFFASLEKVLIDITSRNPHFILLLGDLNAELKTWFINDNSSSKGTQLESLSLLYGMEQLITKPTHVL